MVTAGIIIGLCSYIYQNCSNQIIGAFLFGIGLVTICECQLPLFTGKVGSSQDTKYLINILVNNILGILIAKLLFKYFHGYIVMGIGCGMLMQIGVVMYKKSPIITIMCIAAFLLCGFKHSIAMVFNDIVLLEWLQVIIGNIIGAKIMYYGGVK